MKHLRNFSHENRNYLYTMNIKFDLIIANPPYGKPGANITKNIIDNVYFEEYVNLLPANDYRRNDSKDLFKYAREMESINDGFKDAKVTTHLCKIVKDANNITLDEFEISNYIDKSLNKYFVETRNRHHYAIDNFIYKPTLDEYKKIKVEESIYIGKRDPKSEHLPYSLTSITTRYNKNQIAHEVVLNESAKSEQALGKVGDFYLINFKTQEEKSNMAEFMYSKDGFRFLSKVFVALNIDSAIPLNKFMPKVDWTRSWTVEEILKDYGYTELEIENIMEDLDNFKGMDD